MIKLVRSLLPLIMVSILSGCNSQQAAPVVPSPTLDYNALEPLLFQPGDLPDEFFVRETVYTPAEIVPEPTKTIVLMMSKGKQVGGWVTLYAYTNAEDTAKAYKERNFLFVENSGYEDRTYNPKVGDRSYHVRSERIDTRTVLGFTRCTIYVDIHLLPPPPAANAKQRDAAAEKLTSDVLEYGKRLDERLASLCKS